jgi:MFS transporter, PAT family, beta-lactamase induction signal transducer AmpG
MEPRPFAKPFYFFFLFLPAGISMGFVSVTLPYLLTQHGFSVARTAGIVALGVSANLWRFLWGPVADLTLSLRKWYWIGVIASVVTLQLLCITPFTLKGEAFLMIIVFISQVSATFVMLPLGGVMANRIPNEQKGQASGWYQAGNLGGVGLGGGAGLWLASHYSVMIAGLVLCLMSLLSALFIFFIEDVSREKQETITAAIANLGKSIISMVRIPIVLFVVILVCMPIGTGGASNLFSAIAADWKTNADTVALVTGILSGIVSTVGCVIGGYIADRRGVWVGYLGSGTICALCTIAMAVSPLRPYVYIAGVLGYSFSLGLMNAAFSAVLLFAVGKKNASTKYAMLASLGNLPVVYMTTVDGWAHDRFNSKFMLLLEAGLCLLFVFICVLIIRWLKEKSWLLKTVE